MQITLDKAIDSAIRKAKTILGTDLFSAFRQALEEENVQWLAESFVEIIHSERIEVISMLLQTRTCFECAACCQIAQSYESFPEKLHAIYESMETIAVRRCFDRQIAEQFNSLDMEFHKLLGQFGEVSEAKLIVDALEAVELRYGMPRNSQDMRLIHEEHYAIIGAIKARKTDEIDLAVTKHIQLAYQRWLESHRSLHSCAPVSIGQDVATMLESNHAADLSKVEDPQCGSSIVGSRVSVDVTHEICDSATWDKKYFELFPDQYVVYRVSNSDGTGKHHREIIAHDIDFDIVSNHTKSLDPNRLSDVRIVYFGCVD